MSLRCLKAFASWRGTTLTTAQKYVVWAVAYNLGSDVDVGELGPLTIAKLAGVLEISPQAAGKHVSLIHKKGYLLRREGLLGLPDLSQPIEQTPQPSKGPTQKEPLAPVSKFKSAEEQAQAAWRNAAAIAAAGLQWDHPEKKGRMPPHDFPTAARADGLFALADKVESAQRSDTEKENGDGRQF